MHTYVLGPPPQTSLRASSAFLLWWELPWRQIWNNYTKHLDPEIYISLIHEISFTIMWFRPDKVPGSNDVQLLNGPRTLGLSSEPPKEVSWERKQNSLMGWGMVSRVTGSRDKKWRKLLQIQWPWGVVCEVDSADDQYRTSPRVQFLLYRNKVVNRQAPPRTTADGWVQYGGIGVVCWSVWGGRKGGGGEWLPACKWHHILWSLTLSFMTLWVF